LISYDICTITFTTFFIHLHQNMTAKVIALKVILPPSCKIIKNSTICDEIIEEESEKSTSSCHSSRSKSSSKSSNFCTILERQVKIKCPSSHSNTTQCSSSGRYQHQKDERDMLPSVTINNTLTDCETTEASKTPLPEICHIPPIKSELSSDYVEDYTCSEGTYLTHTQTACSEMTATTRSPESEICQRHLQVKQEQAEQVETQTSQQTVQSSNRRIFRPALRKIKAKVKNDSRASSQASLQSDISILSQKKILDFTVKELKQVIKQVLDAKQKERGAILEDANYAFSGRNLKFSEDIGSSSQLNYYPTLSGNTLHEGSRHSAMHSYQYPGLATGYPASNNISPWSQNGLGIVNANPNDHFRISKVTKLANGDDQLYQEVLQLPIKIDHDVNGRVNVQGSQTVLNNTCKVPGCISCMPGQESPSSSLPMGIYDSKTGKVISMETILSPGGRNVIYQNQQTTSSNSEPNGWSPINQTNDTNHRHEGIYNVEDLVFPGQTRTTRFSTADAHRNVGDSSNINNHNQKSNLSSQITKSIENSQKSEKYEEYVPQIGAKSVYQTKEGTPANAIDRPVPAILNTSVKSGSRQSFV
jgi:uncharacterized membrane protein